MGESVERAGVIPYTVTPEGKIKMMFMLPSDSTFGGDKFQIAKGKIDEGENPEQAAFREAEEELGLFVHNTTNKTSLGLFGTIHVYIAEVINVDLFGEPCFETADTRWMTPQEFDNEGREWQRQVVKAAVRKIKSVKQI